MQNEGVFQNLLTEVTKLSEELCGLEERIVAMDEELNALKAEKKLVVERLVAEFSTTGLEELKLKSGAKIALIKKAYCSPNKNKNDMNLLCDWLKSKSGEGLIKTDLTVDATKEELTQKGIGFSELNTVNTNSLKSFIKQGLANGDFEIGDIPSVAHYYEEPTVEVTV